MKFRKMIATILVLCLIMAALPANVSAAEEVAGGICGTDGDNLTWVLTDDGVLTISGTGDMDDYMLPGRFTGAPWHDYSSQITRIQVTGGVTSIGEYAFYDLDGVTEVELSEGLLEIGQCAFGHCGSIATMTLPESLERIDSGVFTMAALTEISIPAANTVIGTEAFANCARLQAIWVAEDNPNYSSDACGVLFNKDKTELIVCPGGYEGAYVIPDGVTLIQDKAFARCGLLTAVEIPASVTEIVRFGFYWCESLTEVRFLGDAPVIGSEAFFEVYATAYYPAGNDTWTEDVKQNYGGELTWVAEEAPEEPTEPEPTEPEVTEPEPTEPEVTEPEVTEPETTEPTQPEVTEPEVTEPETTAPSEATEPQPTEEVTEPAATGAPTEPASDSKVPQTGDEARLAMALAAVIVSALGITALFLMKRKREFDI